MKTTDCKSCGAPIVWAKPSPLKWLPVDPEPDPKGNVVLNEVHGEVIAKVLGRRDRDRLLKQNPGTVLHLSHWATCPNANGHRE
jgi:hypothetical protein